MNEHQCDVPGFETDGFPSLTLVRGDPEITALDSFFSGLRFLRVSVRGLARFQITRGHDYGHDLVTVTLNVRGKAADLIAHGFMHPDWQELPPCGIKIFSTEGFGGATVHGLKSGELRVAWLSRDSMLELLAPALLPLHFEPAKAMRS